MTRWRGSPTVWQPSPVASRASISPRFVPIWRGAERRVRERHGRVRLRRSLPPRRATCAGRAASRGGRRGGDRVLCSGTHSPSDPRRQAARRAPFRLLRRSARDVFASSTAWTQPPGRSMWSRSPVAAASTGPGDNDGCDRAPVNEPAAERCHRVTDSVPGLGRHQRRPDAEHGHCQKSGC